MPGRHNVHNSSEITILFPQEKNIENKHLFPSVL